MSCVSKQIATGVGLPPTLSRRQLHRDSFIGDAARLRDRGRNKWPVVKVVPFGGPALSAGVARLRPRPLIPFDLFEHRRIVGKRGSRNHLFLPAGRLPRDDQSRVATFLNKLDLDGMFPRRQLHLRALLGHPIVGDVFHDQLPVDRQTDRVIHRRGDLRIRPRPASERAFPSRIRNSPRAASCKTLRPAQRNSHSDPPALETASSPRGPETPAALNPAENIPPPARRRRLSPRRHGAAGQSTRPSARKRFDSKF